MNFDKNALGHVLADILASAVDSNSTAKHAAASAVRAHIRANKPTGRTGGRVRCVFSMRRKVFETDVLDLEAGRVYDITAVGIDAMDLERMTPEE